MLDAAATQQLADSRSYDDLDPQNCWYEWQMTRREMGRKPDIAPGARIHAIDGSDAAYQQTLHDAQASLASFRKRLPNPNALIKTTLNQGEKRVYLWLHEVRKKAQGFTAVIFEISADFSADFNDYAVGDTIEMAADDVLDWLINTHGRLEGGFSLRYARARLSEEARAEYDEYVGVSSYV